MVVRDGAAVQRMINYVAPCHGEISVAEILHFSREEKIRDTHLHLYYPYL